MREEIELLGNVGCEEMDWEHIHNEGLLENWKECMLEWGKDQVEDGFITLYDRNGCGIEEYTIDGWEEYINGIDSIKGIEEHYYDFEWNNFCSFSDFLHGNLY